MSNADIEYKDLVQRIFDEGEPRADRTGVGTWSVFGHQSRYDLRQGLPLITTKKVLFNAVVHELLWMIRGDTQVNRLTPRIWDAWADDKGELGPIYGHQWRSWGGPFVAQGGRMQHPLPAPGQDPVDQLQQVIHDIKASPTSRRLIVSAWNVMDLPYMALPPCHVLFQFYVAEGKWLDCQLYQRSADVAVGLPFNVASYALLTHLVASDCNLKPRYFIHSLGDAHVYVNHVSALRSQMNRDDRPAPTLRVAEGKSIFAVEFSDIELVGYDPHPFIRYEVAV